MKTNPLGNTGLYVSQAGFGVLTMGYSQQNLPLEEGAALIRCGLEHGINFFDTAQYYRTYPYLREALRGGRFEPVIASKSLDGTYDGMKRAVEEARRELDRDVIDIFLLHEVREVPDWSRRYAAWEYLNEAKAKGIVRAIGVSTHHIDVAQQAAVTPECDVLFALINFRSMGIRKDSGPGTKEEMAAAIQACAARGCGVFTMKAFGGGNLTTDYQTALDYAFGVADVASVVVGFGKRSEIEDIAAYLDGRMPSEYQPETRHKRIRIDQSDCEGCGACLRACGSGAIHFNQNGLAMVEESRCITCGYCAYACPVRAVILW